MRYFDPGKEITLSVDASPYGLGAVIMQEGQPIEYASVSLTQTQQRYNHIDKELLAVVYGCERFHYYLFGRQFLIETDHRPLIGLLKKTLDEMSPRIQRLAYKLLRYQFNLKYVPGKNMNIADTLSRDSSNDNINTHYLEEHLKVFSVLSITPANESRLKCAIDQDNELKKLKYYVQQGFPSHKSNVPTEIKRYWPIRSDIYINEDILFYKNRTIIPETLKHEFLELLHRSHQGVVSTKLLAQDSVYWPGIMVDIENMVLSCIVCQRYSRSNSKEPLQPHTVPELPWQKIGIDFKSLGTLNFLIIVDYFSKFIVVNKIVSKTAESVISTLKNVFQLTGLPQEIFSDNGPPYNSKQFSDFAAKYDIKLCTSSPQYAQSNGMVERAIETAKSLLTKSYQQGTDPCLAILDYNVTPKQGLPPPSQLLMGRRLRTTLPVIKRYLNPQYSAKNVRERLVSNQERQKSYYNKNSKRLSRLYPNQKVLMQDGIRQWRPGTVIRKSGPNDYVININNTDYRRNRRFLRPLQESILPTPTLETHSQQKIDERINSEEKENILVDNTESVPPQPTSETLQHNTHNRVPNVTRSGRVIVPPNRLNL